jgi:hypothetical protein
LPVDAPAYFLGRLRLSRGENQKCKEYQPISHQFPVPCEAPTIDGLPGGILFRQKLPAKPPHEKQPALPLREAQA